jgi:hypothetical protein
MISMSLYVLGPVVGGVLAIVLYVLERGPIIGIRWLRFFAGLDAYRRHRRRQ